MTNSIFLDEIVAVFAYGALSLLIIIDHVGPIIFKRIQEKAKNIVYTSMSRLGLS